jgi:hypothetical protein
LALRQQLAGAGNLGTGIGGKHAAS